MIMRVRWVVAALGGFGFAYFMSLPLVVFAVVLAGAAESPQARSILRGVYGPLDRVTREVSPLREPLELSVDAAETAGWELHCRATTIRLDDSTAGSALTSSGAVRKSTGCRRRWTCAPARP